MDCVLKIAKWLEVFERAESRKLKTLNWVAIPTSFSSHGYQALLDEFGDDAPAIYGAWCALVSYAASCPHRGVLASSKGTPIKVGHIARITGFRSAVFEQLINWAVSDEVAWLIPAQPHEIPGFVGENHASGESPDASGESPEHPDRPDPDRPNHIQTDQTGPGRGGGPVGRSIEDVLGLVEECDTDAVKRFANKLDRRFGNRAPAPLMWQIAWVTASLDEGFAGDLINSDTSNRIAKPTRYFQAALKRKCEEDFGVPVNQVLSKIPIPKLS